MTLGGVMDRQVLPSFTADGVLPPGDYPLTLQELGDSMLVSGPMRARPHGAWDATWRRRLVANLAALTRQLETVGVKEVFVDGSFVEDKDHPNDIDGYFECDASDLASGRLERELNRVDPRQCWTWQPDARRTYRGYRKRQLPMWHAYRVELYPHCPGLIAGIDEFGNALEFPAWFRRRRTDGSLKGIVKVVESHRVGEDHDPHRI